MIPSNSSGLPVGGSTGTNPPTVSAGSDQQVAAGVVTLTGTAQAGSTVLWTVTKASDGSSVSVTNSTSTSASFTGVQGESYTATLTATLNGVSAQDSSTIAVAAVALPVITLSATTISQTTPGAVAAGASITGAVSYAWTATRRTYAGVSSTPNPFSDSTAMNPNITTVAEGDVYACRVVATNSAGGTAEATVTVQVRALAWREHDLSGWSAGLSRNASAGGPLDTTASTLTTGGSTLTSSTATSTSAGAHAILGFVAKASIVWADYDAYIVRLDGVPPESASVRSLGVGVQQDGTPAVNEGLSAWFRLTAADNHVASAQVASSGSSTNPISASGNTGAYLYVKVTLGNSGPRAIVAELRDSNDAVLATAMVSDLCTAYVSADLNVSLLFEKASANVESWTGVRLRDAFVPKAAA